MMARERIIAKDGKKFPRAEIPSGQDLTNYVNQIGYNHIQILHF